MKIQICGGQKTLSKIDKIGLPAIPNKISMISMHIPSLGKIHWHLHKLSSGNEKKRLAQAPPTWNHKTLPLSCGGYKAVYLVIWIHLVFKYIYWISFMICVLRSAVFNGTLDFLLCYFLQGRQLLQFFLFFFFFLIGSILKGKKFCPFIMSFYQRTC